MLSSSELTSLQNLITDEEKSFEDLKESFNSHFDKSIYFKIILTLNILIRDHQLNLSQEISSFFILYYLAYLEKDFSSFSSLAIDTLKETKIKLKKIFLLELLKNKIKNHKMKIKEYMEYLVKKDDLEENINLEIEKIKSGKEDTIKKDLYIKAMIYSENKNKSNLFQVTSEEFSFKYFESNYMSYYPFKTNKNFLFKNEPEWIIPMLNHNFIWENNTYDKINFLLKQILSNNSLTKEENKYIISSISKNPNIIKNIKFSPDEMMQLIEKDEYLSSEILSIICKVFVNE